MPRYFLSIKQGNQIKKKKENDLNQGQQVREDPKREGANRVQMRSEQKALPSQDHQNGGAVDLRREQHAELLGALAQVKNGRRNCIRLGRNWPPI